MEDKTIVIKTLIAKFSKDLRDVLNATDEQMLLGLRGAIVQLKDECEREWQRHDRFMKGVEAVAKIMGHDS